jgi:hypothetical protein
MGDTSGYRLVHMDRDGSNLETVFPDEGASALEPQKIIWSPEPMKGNANLSMAVVYNGNIWLINPTTGELQQLTGDGLINRIDWR